MDWGLPEDLGNILAVYDNWVANQLISLLISDIIIYMPACQRQRQRHDAIFLILSGSEW